MDGMGIYYEWLKPLPLGCIFFRHSKHAKLGAFGTPPTSGNAGSAGSATGRSRGHSTGCWRRRFAARSSYLSSRCASRCLGWAHNGTNPEGFLRDLWNLLGIYGWKSMVGSWFRCIFLLKSFHPFLSGDIRQFSGQHWLGKITICSSTQRVLEFFIMFAGPRG